MTALPPNVQPADAEAFAGWSAEAPPSPVTFADVQAAARRLAGAAHRTPVLTSTQLDALVGARVWCKAEQFQRVGAFKFRGAYNALARLRESDPDAAARGVITYSSGNHAQGVALAGRLLDVPTVIVMPSDAPRAKRDATAGYLGPAGEVVLYDPRAQTREELGERLAAERGLTLVPPYDHPDVIAGQGTAAMELIEDVRTRAGVELDALFVCLGGGGLLSGCAIAAKAMTPGCRVIGVEPETAADAAASFRTRRLHTVSNPPTIADGARTPYLGRWTFPLVLQHADEVMTVSDDELRRMMRFALERMKTLIEPSGALGLAGAMQAGAAAGLEGRNVGIIMSGGNAIVDNKRLERSQECNLRITCQIG
jgi:threonine dehydratase